MNSPLVGTQLLPEAVYREGAAPLLDRMQELAHINAVFVFCDTLYLRSFRGPRYPDPDGPEMTDVWVHTHDKYYANTTLPYRQDSTHVHGGVDVLDDMAEAAQARGIDLFARFLEAYRLQHASSQLKTAAQIDVYGQPLDTVCLNHPEYREWYPAIVEDVIRSHPYVAGLKFGQERGGPLSNLLLGSTPLCFCDHCRRRARENGIDIRRAENGWRELHAFIEDCRNDALPRHGDGPLIGFMRLVLRYPEILAWESQWYRSREDHRRRIYKRVKSIDATKRVGWHMVHGMSYDPFFRANVDYAEMRHYSDWIKPVLYFDCAGTRSKGFFDRALGSSLLRGMDPERSFAFVMETMGRDMEQEPGYGRLAQTKTPFTADYVSGEVRRCIIETQGEVDVYAGLGFDVPTQKVAVDTQEVYQATRAAFDAGAAGVILPREWDEANEENIAAAGRAIADVCGAGVTAAAGTGRLIAG